MSTFAKALLTFSILAAWLAPAARAGKTFERYAVSVDGELYLGTVIQEEYSPAFRSIVQKLKNEPIDHFIKGTLTPWLVNTYISYGMLDPAKSQKMIETFNDGSEGLAQPRRTFAFLSKFDQPNEIEVMMSVAYPNRMDGEKVARLPIERRLIGPGEALDPTRHKGLLVAPPQPDHLEIAELKNMAHRRPESPGELARYKKLLAALYNVSEATQMSNVAPSATEFETHPAEVAVYYGETDTKAGDAKSEALLKYYLTELGWEEVSARPNPDLPGNTSHIIRLTRENFVNRALAFQNKRLGDSLDYIMELPGTEVQEDGKLSIYAIDNFSPTKARALMGSQLARTAGTRHISPGRAEKNRSCKALYETIASDHDK